MYQIATEFFYRYSWLRLPEDGANNTETCWGTNMCVCERERDIEVLLLENKETLQVIERKVIGKIFESLSVKWVDVQWLYACVLPCLTGRLICVLGDLRQVTCSLGHNTAGNLFYSPCEVSPLREIVATLKLTKKFSSPLLKLLCYGVWGWDLFLISISPNI